MPKGHNQCQFIGNLGSDPEVRYTQGGTAVCNFSIAVNEQWRDRDGNKQERVEWVRIVIWGKLAEVAEKYLSKGAPVFVQGRLQTRKWQDQSGTDRYTTEVNVDTLNMLGGGRGDGQSQGRRSEPRQRDMDDQEEPRRPPPPDDLDDDIPF